jgi:predicted PurR-regulated permease PerM
MEARNERHVLESEKFPDGAAPAGATGRPGSRRARLTDFLHKKFDIRSLVLTGLFILAVFYTIYFVRAILLPLVLALLLSYLLRPIVRSIKKFRVQPPVSAAILLIALLSVFAYAVSYLATPAAGWLEKAPYSMQQLQQKLLPLRKPLERVEQASGEIEKLGMPGETAKGRAPETVEVKRHPVTEMLFFRTPEVVTSAVLLLILLYFLLASDGVFLNKMIKLLPTLADKKTAVAIATEIEGQISRYLFTITLINIALGIVVGLAVGLLGLPNPVMWGAMVATLNFVPYLGPLTGIVCLMLGAVLTFPSFSYALLFPAVYLGLATLEGNFVTPWIMGRSLTLNPVIILLSIIFWGWMWGIAGIVLAVPILAAFKIFCSHIEGMKPLSEFLT